MSTHVALKWTRLLPEDLRQRTVVLRFRKPVPARRTECFYQIRLTRAMLANGEPEFFETRLVQPYRVGTQVCPSCRLPMRRINVMEYRCDTTGCVQHAPDGGVLDESRRFRFVSGPSRGVVSVRTSFQSTYHGRTVNVSFEVGREFRMWRGRSWSAPLVDGCLLLLDRRYNDDVLMRVYRTAGAVCDVTGMVLND